MIATFMTEDSSRPVRELHKRRVIKTGTMQSLAEVPRGSMAAARLSKSGTRR
jgi:hypothetical protein